MENLIRQEAYLRYWYLYVPAVVWCVLMILIGTVLSIVTIWLGHFNFAFLWWCVGSFLIGCGIQELYLDRVLRKKVDEYVLRRIQEIKSQFKPNENYTLIGHDPLHDPSSGTDDN